MDTRDFFQQATLLICGTLEIETALHRVLQYLRRFIPIDKIEMGVLEERLGAIRVIAHADTEKGEAKDFLWPLSPENRKLDARFESSEEILIINNVEEDPIVKEWVKFTARRDSSFLVMKLILEDGPVGTLGIESMQRNSFTQKHTELISVLRRPFAVAMSNALKHLKIQELSSRLAEENASLYRELMELDRGNHVIGADGGLRHVFSMVNNVSSVDTPVLLLGETGSGKDVIANTIHMTSGRAGSPFIKINCGAIPDNLLDSELFGHEKGAFTGAHAQRRGCFERAHQGTLFLDEIGELPPGAQVRMLRVLQHKEIVRVGGKAPIIVDVRILAATNRDLKKMVRDGRFREDLWFRLNVFPIDIPPLRARKEDIPALVHHLIEARSRALKIYPAPQLAQGAIDQLMQYDWPGNVRELENIIERSLILNRGALLRFNGLLNMQSDLPAPSPVDDDEAFPTLEAVTAAHIHKALRKTNGRVQGEKGAAKLLGLNPSTLRNRMLKSGISFGRKAKQL